MKISLPTYIKNRKPIILAIGDSFTDPNFQSHLDDLPDEKRGGWKMWPAHLKDKLDDLTGEEHFLINAGKGGAGTTFMFREMSKAFATHGDRIKYVFWGSTEWQRHEDFWTGSFLNIGADINWYEKLQDLNWQSEDSDAGKALSKRYPNLKNIEMIKAQGWYFKEKYCRRHGQRKILQHGAEHMYLAHWLATTHGAQFMEYTLLRVVPPCNWVKRTLKRVWPELDDIDHRVNWNDDWRNMEWLSFPYANYLQQHKKHFAHNPFLHLNALGSWPDEITREIGNGSPTYHEVCKLRVRPHHKKTDPKNESFGKVDGHPNADGQKDIAERMWKYYVENLV